MAPLLLLLMACGFLEQGDGGGGPPAAPVEVAEVRGGILDDTRSFLGEVRAVERAELAAGAVGRVEQVTVREGDRVARGDLLVEVDPSVAAAAWRAADAARVEGEASRDEARSQMERLRRVADGVVAPHDLEQAEARLRAAEARLASLTAAAERARAELARHRVRAPFAGIVAGRHVDPGDWVSPGTPALDLVSAEQVEILVGVPPEVVAVAEVGDPVALVGMPGVSAEVAGLVPALDPETRTALVRLTAEASDRVVPGASVQVTFAVPVGDGVLVPRDALVQGPTGTRVIEVIEGLAAAVPVEVRATTRETVLVSGEGLEPGDVVVVRGNERLRPGQPVRVTQ